MNDSFTQHSEGWVTKKLGNAVLSVLTGPFGSMLHKSDYVENGVPIVNPVNINDDKIRPNISKTVSKKTAERLTTYRLDEGDVVIGRRGEIGRCAVVMKEQSGWLCGTGCFYIKSSGELNSYFLSNLLRSNKYREKLEKIATGATMKNLSNTSLKNLIVTFPKKYEEQSEIVCRLRYLNIKMQDLEFIYQKKLTALAELKQSLLQKAFSGELTASVAEQKVSSVA